MRLRIAVTVTVFWTMTQRDELFVLQHKSEQFGKKSVAVGRFYSELELLLLLAGNMSKNKRTNNIFPKPSEIQYYFTKFSFCIIEFNYMYMKGYDISSKYYISISTSLQ